MIKSLAPSLVLGLGLLCGCGQVDSGARGTDGGAVAGAGNSAAGSSNEAGSSSGGSGGSASGGSGNTTAGRDPIAGSGAGGSMPSMGGSGGGNAGKPCGPAWVAGQSYAEGAIVQFMGAYYIAEHENPGYDPTISTYFWNPYACATDSGGSAGAGGSAPVGDSAFAAVVSESLFHQMFPDRDAFYTYQGLVEATRKYAGFVSSGSADQRKREAAAFLANVARETGELVYIEQIEQGPYCAPSGACPCEPGKSYFGRGPIQISWNYNYCEAGVALGYDLRAQPELVAQNPTVAWATGLWFWMTQRGAGTYTPHDAIVGEHGFGESIRSINGDLECGGAPSEGVTARVDFYQRFCQLLGVSPGTGLTC